MNRAYRRKNGIPQEENKQVQLYISEGTIVLKMIGVTSKVASHVYLSPGMALNLGWAIIKSAWKAYKINWKFWRKE